MEAAGDVVELERRIAARAETVFSYFTDPQRFVQWFGMDAEIDARPGGTFRATVTGRSRLVARGTFIEVGLSTPAEREFHGAGWDHTLDRLTVVAGGGDPGPDPAAYL